MYKRFIKWSIAQDSKGRAVDVYEDSYGRIFLDETFWFDKEFLDLKTGVWLNEASWMTAPKRFVTYEEVQKVQEALRQHIAEFPRF